MHLKAKEIAEHLGISPATVSLAVNNRPGVSEKTRLQILEYIRNRQKQLWMEDMQSASRQNGTVLYLDYIKNGLIMEQQERKRKIIPSKMVLLPLQMKECILAAGYQFEYIAFHEQSQDLEQLLSRCRELNVRGIYIIAAEMTESDIYPFLQLNVPIVAGDSLFDANGVDCYLIDNRDGIACGIEYLESKGHSHIVYLAENLNIFNFRERREAFLTEMTKRQLGDAENRIWKLGSSIDEVYQSMLVHLNKGLHDTTAFIMESSIISLGACKALMERRLRIPQDISLIGFDMLPHQGSIPGIQLTMIKGTHTKRHLDAVSHLLRRIQHENEEIMKVYYRTHLIEGNSVFDKKKYIYSNSLFR